MTRSKPPFRADVVGSLLRTAPLKEARARREQRRDQRAPAQGGRGPRDREDHQKAGGGRAQARDRRRVPPLMVAFRFPRHARRGRDVHTRPRHPVPRGADQGAEHPHQGEARIFQPPHARSFQVPQGACARRAEDDASRARRCCISASSRTPSTPRSMPTATPSSTTWLEPTNKRSALSTTPAAAICNSTIPSGPISARRREMKKARDRGLKAERLAQDYAGVINRALEGKPADMVITTHVCRGNFRSTWISEGGYEAGRRGHARQP